jgi:molybdopterin-binding protein
MVRPYSQPPEAAMLSARNQFKGTVKSVKLGGVMAEVVVEVNGLEFVSAITRTSAEHLALQAGVEVTVVVKSTEVLIARD